MQSTSFQPADSENLVQQMDADCALEKSLALRRSRHFGIAYKSLRQAVRAGHSDLKSLVWQHNPIFWIDIPAGICTLNRRNAEDAAFLRQFWQEPELVYQFHRHSAPLPKDDAKLQRILDQEMSSIISESHAIHWVIRDAQGRPWGLLSLCDISITHRRAEVLLGILPGAPIGTAAAAMLMLFQFYFNIMKFNKLVSFIYPENTKSIKSTMHLGFKKEGELRGHTLDPKSGKYLDMLQFGLLKDDAFKNDNKRIAQRLLGPR